MSERLGDLHNLVQALNGLTLAIETSNRSSTSEWEVVGQSPSQEELLAAVPPTTMRHLRSFCRLALIVFLVFAADSKEDSAALSTGPRELGKQASGHRCAVKAGYEFPEHHCPLTSKPTVYIVVRAPGLDPESLAPQLWPESQAASRTGPFATASLPCRGGDLLCRTWH